VLDKVKAWPLWVKIVVPVVLFVAIVGIAGANNNTTTTPQANTTSPVSKTTAAATTVKTTIGPRPTTTTKPKPTTTKSTTTTSRPKAIPPPATHAAPPVTAAGALIPLPIVDPSGYPTYVRNYFGSDWIDANHDCRNTRAEVLIRQSEVLVTFTRRGCTVAKGLWHDPWSTAVTTIAHDFDIDHTVPLDNAWRSGAWRWSSPERIDYANDLSDTDHLLAIPSSENRSKGDSGPDGWKPPLRSTWCRYARSWDHIKARWHLSATHAEWAALIQMAGSC
jgi:hypothetical protein